MTAIRVKIETARALKPLLKPSRYKALYGGRGSMKSHFFASLAVERSLLQPGTRGVCVREVQKDLKESAKLLIEDKIESFGVSDLFDCQRDRIVTPGGGAILFQGMQDHTADSIKSLEGFDWAWVEEAQTLSARSLEILKPTLRKGKDKYLDHSVQYCSEIWFSWNPRNADDPVDKMFRGMEAPEDAIIIKVSYKDNPWFPGILDQERQYDERNNRDRYAHIWLGDYEPTAIGAIWDRQTIHQGRRAFEDCPSMARIVIAVDPAVTGGDNSDEHGIIVCAFGEDQRGYVLDDGSLKGGPHDWANRVMAMYDKWEADSVVVETNQGGDMVRHTLQSVRPSLPITEVRASRGKHVRAEPISALYKLGRVSHAGTFTKLEDQLCQMTSAGYEGPGSPDRVDAMVWGFAELFPTLIRQKNKEVVVESLGEVGWMA